MGFMSDLVLIIVFIAAYIILNKWLLPKMGVPT